MKSVDACVKEPLLIRENRFLKYKHWLERIHVPYSSAIRYTQNGVPGVALIEIDYKHILINRETSDKLEDISNIRLYFLAGKSKFKINDLPDRSEEAQRKFVVDGIRKKVLLHCSH